MHLTDACAAAGCSNTRRRRYLVCCHSYELIIRHRAHVSPQKRFDLPFFCTFTYSINIFYHIFVRSCWVQPLWLQCENTEIAITNDDWNFRG